MTERHFKLYVMALVVIAVALSFLPGVSAVANITIMNFTSDGGQTCTSWLNSSN